MKIARSVSITVPKVCSCGRATITSGYLRDALSSRPAQCLANSYLICESHHTRDQSQDFRCTTPVYQCHARTEEPPGNDSLLPVACTYLLASCSGPLRYEGPFDDEEAFNASLRDDIRPESIGSSGKAHEDALQPGDKSILTPHSIPFAHGDLLPHNILIKRRPYIGYL